MYDAQGTGLVSAGATALANVGSPSKVYQIFVITCTPTLDQSVGVSHQAFCWICLEVSQFKHLGS